MSFYPNALADPGVQFRIHPSYVQTGDAFSYGTAWQVNQVWDDADPNANCFKVNLPTGGAVDVPVVAYGIDILERDLGFWNGQTQPLIAVVDADRDSWAGLTYNADDEARITKGGSAWMTEMAGGTIPATADHTAGIDGIQAVYNDLGTLVSGQTYRAGYYRYNVKSTTPSNPTSEITGLEGVVGVYIPDESLTARGLYGRFYIDTDTDATSTLRTGIGGEFSARASYSGGTAVTAEAGTAFIGARIWMAPYFTAGSVDNVNNFWGLWVYGEHATQRNADAAINVGEAGGGWTDILRVTPASDKDVNIIHVDVTGDPTFYWDESEDRFVFTHAIETIAVYIRTAEDFLYMEETDQVDPAGRWRFRLDGDILYLEHALTAAWATDEDWVTYDYPNALISILKNTAFDRTIPATESHATGITSVSDVINDLGTLVTGQTYRAGYYRYNVKSTTPGNPTAEITGLEAVAASYTPDEGYTLRGGYLRTYIDTDTDPTATARTSVGAEISARASYNGGAEVGAEAGTAFVGARIWMAPYFSNATIANVNNFHALWILNEADGKTVTNAIKIDATTYGSGFTYCLYTDAGKFYQLLDGNVAGSGLEATDSSAGGSDIMFVRAEDYRTLTSAAEYRAGYFRYNIRSATPSNPTCEVTGVEGVVGSYIADEAITARGGHFRTYIDANATYTLRTSVGCEMSARASYAGGTECAAEAGTAFVGARVWMAPYFSAATVDNVNNFWGLWIYGEHATQRNADAAIFISDAGGGFTDYLRLTPAADGDINIVHVGVTGDPIFWWDESEDAFAFNKPITGLTIVNLTVTGYIDHNPAARSLTPSDTGSWYDQSTQTLTDNGTAGAGTNALATFNSFAQPTLAAENAGVTTTNAYTVYIANAPAAGANMTITRPWAFGIAAGKSYFGGGITLVNDTTGALEIQDADGTVRDVLWKGTSNEVFLSSSVEALYIQDSCAYDVHVWGTTAGTGRVFWLDPTPAASGAGNVADSPTLRIRGNYRNAANALVYWPFDIFLDMTAGGATPAGHVDFGINSVDILSLFNTNALTTIGLWATSFGTSADKVLGFGSGTAPADAPADMSQIWVQDVAAGYAAPHMMVETNAQILTIVGVYTKADTGQVANPYEGLMEINTFDNTVKIYADAGWRTIASW